MNGRLESKSQDVVNPASDQVAFASGQLFVLSAGLTAHVPYEQGRK